MTTANDSTTLDTRTPAERAYDAERAGTLYFPSAAPAQQITADTGEASGAEPDTLAGYLPDGTPIYGEYLIDAEPRTRWGVVSVDFPGWRITMDHDGYFTIANDAGGGKTLCDEWHMRDLPARRAAVSHMLLSDTLERLYAAAIAWERGDSRLPVPLAPASVGPASDGEQVGVIHGCAVYIARYDEPGEECHGQVYRWSLDWNGKTISVYDDSDALTIHPLSRVDCRGDIHFGDWQWLRSLSQTDVVERLFELARGGDPQPPTFPAPADPAIRVEQWSGEDGGAYTDFVAGDGLTKVMIGTYGGDKSGVELIIGGTAINEGVEQIITLADVRQLRDNLTTLLEDARLADACARAEADAPQKLIA